MTRLLLAKGTNPLLGDKSGSSALARLHELRSRTARDGNCCYLTGAALAPVEALLVAQATRFGRIPALVGRPARRHR